MIHLSKVKNYQKALVAPKRETAGAFVIEANTI